MKVSTPRRPTAEHRAKSGGAAFILAARTWALASRAAGGALSRAELFAGGLLSAATTNSEKDAIGWALYGDHPGPYLADRGLFDWEERWLAESLPPPPARILIGGAGGGREAAVLAARGYDVDAFEPAHSQIAVCRSALADDSRVVCASYQDLADAVFSGGTRAADLAERRYDAFLFGWSSLSSVLDAGERERAVRAAAAVTPRGPLLVSALSTAGAQATKASRARRLGAALGSAIARVRGARGSSGELAFSSYTGFTCHIDPRELALLAADLARPIVFSSVAGFELAAIGAPD